LFVLEAVVGRIYFAALEAHLAARVSALPLTTGNSSIAAATISHANHLRSGETSTRSGAAQAHPPSIYRPQPVVLHAHPAFGRLLEPHQKGKFRRFCFSKLTPYAHWRAFIPESFAPGLT
jgi:hypothetical protein